MAFVLRRCCERYAAARQERQQAWQKCAVRITAAGQRAQVPESKAVRPDYRAIHSQVVQDVRPRVERTCQACCRRVTAGETPGYARFKSSTRDGSCTHQHFTDQQCGHGAPLANGLLVRATSGRLAVRWRRPLEGTPKTVPLSRAADGWYAGLSCAEVPLAPLPLTGCKTGSDVGLPVFLVRVPVFLVRVPVFLVRADGEPVEHPRHDRRAERPRRRA
jgi:putative transposase